jgi:hypothetical protein
MSRKKQIVSVTLLAASLGLSAPALFAQTAPGPMGPNPSTPQPGPTLPRETQPTIPGQPAPGLPQTQPMPGQPGTIPERVQPPRDSMVLSSGDIKKAQDALKMKGLNPGTDGQLDAKTQQALRDFQKANDLPMTGTLDDKTAAKLGIDIGTSGKALPKKDDSSKGAVSPGPARSQP